ncbi:hypothetical protein C8Q76DRAFT_697915 [Earliella scabrosa]|nr:hypothetical protein C8Q76DRAFT_697915 [Earliella scabrosa]
MLYASDVSLVLPLSLNPFDAQQALATPVLTNPLLSRDLCAAPAGRTWCSRPHPKDSEVLGCAHKAGTHFPSADRGRQHTRCVLRPGATCKGEHNGHPCDSNQERNDSPSVVHYHFHLDERYWDRVGTVYEMCIGPENEWCANHATPLACQMLSQQRLDFLAASKSLSPPPYNSEMRRGQVVLWHEELADKMRVQHPEVKLPATLLHYLNIIPRAAKDSTRATSSSSCAVKDNTPTASSPAVCVDRGLPPKGTSSQAAVTGRGRPKNPTCSVEVIVFVRDAADPEVITAKGILRDGLVELVFVQVEIDMPDSLRFLRWHTSIDDWSEFPRRSHSNWLAPGEHLLYRELSVSHMPRFQEWKAYATGGSSSKPTTLSLSGSALPQTHVGAGESATAPRVTPAGTAETAAAPHATLKRARDSVADNTRRTIDPLIRPEGGPAGEISACKKARIFIDLTEIDDNKE